MTPLQAAARFAAFVWYTNRRKGPRAIVQDEARQYAQDHWQAFLPIANEGLGRLLLRVARPHKNRKRRQSPSHRWQSNGHAAALNA